MKNSEYWEDRIANNTWTVYNSLEEKNKALMEMYQEATLDIQNELYTIAQKINGGKSVTLSDMHKYNRLNSLQSNIEKRIEQLGEDTEKFGKENMKEGFKEVYSNARQELGETSFSIPNERLMEQMMNTPWQGSNFSKRLWKNTGVLVRNLNEILTIGLTQGKTITEMAIQLSNRMNQSFNAAHKLIRTETIHYLNESAFKAYQDGGCEEVEVWAAKDERTCEVCGKRHGKKYKIDKRPVLPFHPNCRCTYLPVINKEEAKKEKIVNANGDEIKFKFEDKNKKSKTIGIIKNLANQYNTRLISVNQGGAGKAAGLTDVAGNIWLNNSQDSTIIHEFAHSIAQTATDTLKITNNKEFWKEIKKLRREYIKVIEKDPSKIISFYSKSEKDKYDEFMAEAFTQIKLSEMNLTDKNYGDDLTYAKKVLSIIDKYFKK